MPAVGFGIKSTNQASKLKLSNQSALAQDQINDDAVTLTMVGRAVRATSRLTARIASVPRLISHAGMVGLVGSVVLTGSTGNSAQLMPSANRVGQGSTMDQAVAVELAAKVASETNLLVTSEVSMNAQTLNAQVAIPTSNDGTLAKRQVVDTAGSAARGILSHQVKPGDTVVSLAAQYNITTDTLRWANGLAPDAEIKPNQNLVILPVSGIKHTVQTGDTAKSLAEKFKSNPDQIIAFNNAEIKGLQVGQTVVIPDGVMPGTQTPVSNIETPSTASSTQPVNVAPGGPNSYAYGYCTYYVALKRAIPSSWGNANAWYSNAQRGGYAVGNMPRPGAIAWTPAGYYGHVAYVESVKGGMVTVSEMNYYGPGGGWNRISSRTVPASSFKYIY